MGIGVVVAAALAAGGIALAFYMDWLGLWVSEEEMRAKREAAKGRMRLLEVEAGSQFPVTDASAMPCAEVSGKALAFDVDAVSMGTLRAALPAWKFEVANGPTAASLVRLWRGRADGPRRRGPPRECGGVVGAVPLLVFMPPGQEWPLEEALAVGTHRRLLLPIQAAEGTHLLVHPHAGHGPGRHSPNNGGTRCEVAWRDVGDEG
jgi:hypothetical protein